MALFRDVPEDDLGWMQEFRDSQYLLPASEILFQEGEIAHSLYTLFDGWMILSRSSAMASARSCVFYFLVIFSDFRSTASDQRGDTCMAHKP